MPKKKVLLISGMTFLIVAGIVALLAALIKHEPGFYRRAIMPPGKDRIDLSKACFGRFFTLGANWMDGKGEWSVTFSEAQLNSYFEEDFVRLGDAEALRKQGISDPRIVLENDRLRLAFRYGRPPWSTVISYDLRVWLAPKDVNVVCFEILGRHAGALPMSSQSLLNEISEVAGRRGVEVQWFRHEGNPVALVRFQADRAKPSAHLRRLEVKQGLITIGGISLDPVQTSGIKRALAPTGN